MEFDPTITAYRNVLNTKEPNYIPLSAMIEHLKVDKYGISAMRKRGVTSEDKKSLPIACFCGKFQERLKTGLIEASGLIVLDFDGKTPQDAKKFRDRLLMSEYVHLLFTSPSGNGVKVLFRIPECGTDEEFKEYFNALQVKFPDVDRSGKDISRACFFSYDPDLYYNPSSKVWETKLKAPRVEVDRSNVKNDYGIINRCANIIQNAVPGERHDKILRAAHLAGGFVGSNEIDREEAERILINVANQINPDEPWINEKTVLDGVAEGILKPIESDGGAHEALKKEEIEQKLGKIYYTAEDVAEELNDLWVNGIQKGYDLYFENANQYISFKLGCTTYVYGQAYSGKSYVFFEFLIQLAHKHDLKVAIFSPEMGKAAEIYVELMQMYTTKGYYHGDGRMTLDEREEAYKWVAANFVIVDPSNKVFSVDDFYEYIDIIERVYATKIDITVLDPWNEVKHDWGKFGRDIYMEEKLGHIRQNARAKNRHNVIITHARDLEILTDKDTGIRYFPPPMKEHVANGQAWARKGEQMVAVWRPKEGLKDENGVDYGKYDSIVIVQKSKPRGVGKMGKFKLQYEPFKYRYFEPEYPDGSVKYDGKSQIFATLEKDSRKTIVKEDENNDIWKDANIDSFENDPPF